MTHKLPSLVIMCFEVWILVDILGDDPPAISCLHQPAICLNVSLMPRKHRKTQRFQES